MATKRKTGYKYCIVPQCKSTTIKTPNKLFFGVPRKAKARQLWCKVMKRDEKANRKLSVNSRLYCCEDHFDIEKDMANYTRYRIMGHVDTVKLKPDITPHIFECQRLEPITPIIRTGALKRRRIELVEEALREATKDVEIPGTSSQEEPSIEPLVAPKVTKAKADKCVQTNLKPSVRSKATQENQSADEEMKNQVHVFIKEEPSEEENVVNLNSENEIEIVKEELPDYEYEDETNMEMECNIKSEITIKDEPLEDISDELEAAGSTSNHCMTTMGMECLNKNLENLPHSNNIRDNATVEYPINIEEENELDKISKESSVSCDICNVTCQNETSYYLHLRIHLKSFICLLCDFRTTHKNALKVHLRTHTGEKPYVCNLCDFKSAYNSALQIHLKIHTGEKPHVCEFCGFKCIQKRNLENHLRTHTGERPYACDVCDFKSTRNDVLQNHLKTHSTERPFACLVCNFRSSRKHYLHKHLRVHTGEKPYSCKICDYKSGTKSNLQSHQKIHTTEKPYTCKLCEFKSAHKNALQIHLKTHSTEKPFACELCDFKSTRNDVLQNHLRTHTGEKPFSCHSCSFKTAHKYLLQRHIRMHEGKIAYACKLCDFKSENRKIYQSHLKAHLQNKQYSFEMCDFESDDFKGF